ncbi:MAG: ribosome recycling factor [Saprospiraceae bacterium]|nr:ribosome recycling factor [Saprospiraceae bacterium]
MRQEEINQRIEATRVSMEHSIEHLTNELVKVRTGKATPSLVSSVMVPYYGSPTLLSQVANVTVADSRTLLIQPWEKKMIGPIEKAIFEANLGVTPGNDGEFIRITIPPLTEERRKELVKKCKHLGEESKVGVRNARREMMEAVKKAIKDGLPEDAGKKTELDIQHLTDKYSEKIDKLLEVKEKEILTV